MRDSDTDFVSLPRDRRLFAPNAPTMLMYHKVGSAPFSSRFPTLYVTPARFERQIGELLDAGASCLSVEQTLAASRAAQPGFCVTFDDGFRNVFDAALPVLLTRSARAIQFIVAGCIGQCDEWDRGIEPAPRQPLMDDAQIRDWLAAGQAIGAHTMTHPRLTQLSLKQARAEIFDSRRLLEDRYGIPVRHFCYPYGDYNAAVRDLVREAGYESACTVTFGVNEAGIDAYELRRVLACDPPTHWRRVANKAVRALRGLTS